MGSQLLPNVEPLSQAVTRFLRGLPTKFVLQSDGCGMPDQILCYVITVCETLPTLEKENSLLLFPSWNYFIFDTLGFTALLYSSI